MIDPNPLDPLNPYFRSCLKGHVDYSVTFSECPSCKIIREREALMKYPVIKRVEGLMAVKKPESGSAAPGIMLLTNQYVANSLSRLIVPESYAVAEVVVTWREPPEPTALDDNELGWLYAMCKAHSGKAYALVRRLHAHGVELSPEPKL